MDFSDWKPGNWCWLPPLPPGRTSGDSSRVTPKAEGNTNADPRKTPEEAVPKVEGVPHGHANASLSSTPPSRKPHTKTEHTKNEEDSNEAKAKYTKKEEVEDDTHRDQSVPAETVKSEYGLATSLVPSRGTRCNVKHERPKEEDDPPDALSAGEGRRDYSGWTTGSWCWLPPIPTAVASDSNSNSNSNSNSDSKPLAAGVATVGPRCKLECATRPNQEEDPNDDLAAETDEDRSAWRAGSWSWLPDEADAVPVSAAPRGTFPAGARRKRARDYDYDDYDYDYDDDDDDDDNQEFDSDRQHLDSSPSTETMARNKRVRSSHRRSSRIGRAKRDPEDDESVSDESSEFEFEDDDESVHGFNDDDDGFDETDDYDDDDDDPSIRVGASEFSEGDSPSVDGDADSDDATSTDVPHASEEPNGEKSRFDAAWETKFQQLAKYKKQHGTTKVLTNDRSLSTWMCEQRSKKKAGKLSEKRVARLESIGFEWNPFCSTWETMYMRLVEYKKKYKNTNVSRACKEDPQLGLWVQTQRHRCKRKERIDRLNRIGFVWNRRMEIEKQWNMMYQRLVEYKKEHNTTRVPSDYKADPKLGIWVQTQRKYCLRKDRVQRLNEIGFGWVAGATRTYHDEFWEKMYQRLVEYKKNHNTTLVPCHYKSDPKLGNWVFNQRCERLRKDRVKRLNDIGFVWNARAEYENQWHVMYQRLVEYKKKHNTTRVPSDYKADPTLGSWVKHQRSSCHRKDRLKLLNDIGFIWNERAEMESRWDVMYQRLVEYKKKHNTTRVPKEYEADPKLGHWVSSQRKYCHRKDRIDRLDAIGFIWKARAEIGNDQWDVMYQRLVAYKKKHNTTRVPTEYEADPKLGRWVSKQRASCHRKDRIDRLDAIGFVWDARNP